jgi:dCMP deaminase
VINIVEWDELFMSMVFLIASKSKDIHTHVGAVVVDNNNIIRSMGYNGLPRGVDDNVKSRFEKPEKYLWMVHAEQNAIYNAQSNLQGCRMYTNGIPCNECAKAIIQSGITEVIVHSNWNLFNNKHNLYYIDKSLMMFDEVGINLRYYNGNILNIKGWRDGKEFKL